jgi:tetratricopeptide (TPR) repeat protein
MSSSKEVFALRKEGSLDEAYAMALEVIEADPNDEWNIKAIAWCLYDLTKRSISQNDYTTAKTYVEHLEALQINEFDEILLKSVEHAKVLASPEKRIILQAKEKSKQGNHQEALTLFRQAIQQFPNDIDLNTQFAWELQKEGKIIFDAEKVEVQKARQLLADYIKLKNERPSQLHSLFLRFADKITDREEFNLISFLKLWNLNNLREEDFEPFTKLIRVLQKKSFSMEPN